jgi:hypothetical protein
MKATRVIVALSLWTIAAAGCGSVTSGAPDGGAGATGHAGSGGAAGQAGSAGAAGQGAAGQAGGGVAGQAGGTAGQGGATGTAGQGGSTGTAGQGGSTGAAGHAGSSGAAGQGGSGGVKSDGGADAIDAGPPCAGLDEPTCRARTDCRANSCPDCQSVYHFTSCSASSDPPLFCGAAQCPVTCSTATTLVACEARSDCHAVFFDPGTCGCAAAGCCEHFSRCADGAKANCTGPALCKAATPLCDGSYVVSFTGSCYEGCVQQKDCAP